MPDPGPQGARPRAALAETAKGAAIGAAIGGLLGGLWGGTTFGLLGGAVGMVLGLGVGALVLGTLGALAGRLPEDDSHSRQS